MSFPPLFLSHPNKTRHIPAYDREETAWSRRSTRAPESAGISDSSCTRRRSWYPYRSGCATPPVDLTTNHHHQLPRRVEDTFLLGYKVLRRASN